MSSCDVDAKPPRSSETLSETVYVPARPYEWAGATSEEAGVRSPKSHVRVIGSPSGSLPPVNMTSSPTSGPIGKKVKAADGGLFSGGGGGGAGVTWTTTESSIVVEPPDSALPSVTV